MPSASKVVRGEPDQQATVVESHGRRAPPPDERTAASEPVATSTFCGYGSPWLISVDSRATTGVPVAQRLGDLGGDGTRRSAQVDHMA